MQNVDSKLARRRKIPKYVLGDKKKFWRERKA
jgi:hypothetical protein